MVFHVYTPYVLFLRGQCNLEPFNVKSSLEMFPDLFLYLGKREDSVTQRARLTRERCRILIRIATDQGENRENG